MLFDIGAASDTCSSWVARSKPVRGLLRNPFLTGLIVTAIVYAVMYALMSESFVRASWQTILRGAVYSTIAVMLVMIVHNYVTACDVRERLRDSAHADILKGLAVDIPGLADADAVPVVVGAGSRFEPNAYGAGGEALLPGTAASTPSTPAASTPATSTTMTPIPLPGLPPADE